MHEQEEGWVRAAREGNKQAFSHLVEAYQRPVYNLSYRMLSNAEEAEDAAQETFLRAFSRLAQFDDSHKFSTWILSIANHYCIDKLRKRRTRYVSLDDNPVLENLQEDKPQPEGDLLNQEQKMELQLLLNRLEPEYRTPLILRYWEDYSYEDIATTLGLTISAVKSRLFRARQQMAELYANQQVASIPPSAGGHKPKKSEKAAQPARSFFTVRTAFAS